MSRSDPAVDAWPFLAALPGDAVVSGMSAARAHGLWLPPWAGATALEVSVPVAETRPAGRPHTRRDVVRHRRRLLRPDEVVELDGVPVTSVARTWVDLAERLPLVDLVAAGDSARRVGADSAELDEMIGRAGHRRGVVRARAARDLLDPRARSRPESHLRVQLVLGGLPKPEVNVPVTVDGEWLGEPDAVYREARLGIEYQGEVHADPARMRRDITRALDFAEHDWLLMMAGPDQVFRFPERFVRQVRFEWTRRRHGRI